MKQKTLRSCQIKTGGLRAVNDLPSRLMDAVKIEVANLEASIKPFESILVNVEGTRFYAASLAQNPFS
jgi:hypothetical protein